MDQTILSFGSTTKANLDGNNDAKYITVKKTLTENILNVRRGHFLTGKCCFTKYLITHLKLQQLEPICFH